MDFKNKEKILLILDIDETLIFATEKALDRDADFQVFDYHVYKRPYLASFINAVRNDFLLAVWSSASDDYVQEVVKHLQAYLQLLKDKANVRHIEKRNWQHQVR